MTSTPPKNTAQQYWDDFYRDPGTGGSGEPNVLLVREVASLTPGTALDLGCAGGSDALWLAGLGWRVTAADVSATALRRAAERAADAGLTDRIDWQRHDLSESFPEGSYDLVSAQFLHSPVARDGEREDILDRAADAVAPGGVLVIGSHAGWPSWQDEPPFAHHFPTNAEMLARLDPARRGWTVETDELLTRELAGPDGRPGTRADSVLRLRRAR
ncbi:class I SAM-dependent methyltransferase [Streptomyces lasiicapitis]|uniref:class I SAM-dependent methyltransferase n=1 Tax=Streptomyces lasiicapitis TaxID=1923961 RepID=UPI00332A8FCE